MPQFYLRHWCGNDGKLLVHPVGKKAFPAKPKSFASENGLYDTVPHDTIRDHDLEANLSKIESMYSPFWPVMFSQIGDSPAIKINLARFLALTYLRHPDRKDLFESINSIYLESLAHSPEGQNDILLEVKETLFTFSAVELSEHLESGAKGVDESFLRSVFTSVDDVAEILSNRKWGILESEKPEFFTSDNPLILLRGRATTSHYGFGTSGTLIIFPLSPQWLLVICDSFDDDGLFYPCHHPEKHNLCIARSAQRFYFSSPREL